MGDPYHTAVTQRKSWKYYPLCRKVKIAVLKSEGYSVYINRR
jgi:hypothetical protein